MIAETTYVSSSTSSWPWAPTHGSPSTTTPAPTSQWWPPLLTSRTTSPRPSTYQTTETTTSTTQRPTTPYPTKPPKKPTTASTEDPENHVPEETTPGNNGQCVAGKYYADPANCGSYFMCVYGRKKQHFCAIGLHWNGKSQICDWPSKANCWEHLISKYILRKKCSTLGNL